MASNCVPARHCRLTISPDERQMKEDSSHSDLVEGITDTFGRPLKNLRLSVTDRCNLRCKYCMPEEEYVWLPREDILSFEEMTTLAGYFTDLGVDKVRLTGGGAFVAAGPCAAGTIAPSESAHYRSRVDDERRALG